MEAGRYRAPASCLHGLQRCSACSGKLGSETPETLSSLSVSPVCFMAVLLGQRVFEIGKEYILSWKQDLLVA